MSKYLYLLELYEVLEVVKKNYCTTMCQVLLHVICLKSFVGMFLRYA